MDKTMYTASTALLEALSEAKVSYLFANLGSDHPGIVEALAEAGATRRPAPQLITCPNEMVALSAAHGFAQVTGQAQAVLVHVECGTQALAGALHNAAKGRMPVLIFAGASPFTQEGELRGSRNEFIHWIQDVFDQRGIVRGYVKYDNEIRTGRNIKQMTHRALQLAHSDPRGPVYLMAAREVLEEEVPNVAIDATHWSPVASLPLPAPDVAGIVDALRSAQRPLIVTSYSGRNPQAVAELVRLCDALAVGVLESAPNYVNFPASHPLHQGVQWSEPRQNAVLAEADVILVIDSDIPWIPLVNKPVPDAVIYHLDVDPLKEQMPLFQLPARRVFRVDAATALAQMNMFIAANPCDQARIAARRAHYEQLHQAYQQQLRAAEQPHGEQITPQYLMACLRECLDDNTIVLNEGITNYKVIFDHLGLSRAGAMLTSGGGSLGWNGGAAIGVKLARPDKTVIAITGDGSYMFSVPSSVHWMARRYQTPFLQIVLNNGGWNAPRFSTLAAHPEGYASRAEDIGVSFEPAPDYAGIAAAAGGAFARTVRWADELSATLAAAWQAVQSEHRCAVLDVRLTNQTQLR
jgi:acetolactate synthase-1/2/3 large subunit